MRVRRAAHVKGQAQAFKLAIKLAIKLALRLALRVRTHLAETASVPMGAEVVDVVVAEAGGAAEVAAVVAAAVVQAEDHVVDLSVALAPTDLREFLILSFKLWNAHQLLGLYGSSLDAGARGAGVG
jgi:hypothetical protein